jgi:hypothetical protein
MIKLSDDSKKQFIEYCKTKGVCLEGNILKVLDTSDDPEWEQYVSSAIEKDTDIRKKRLEMTKQIQSQNIELVKWKTENEKINDELKAALSSMEKSKEAALNDLDILQKRTQYHLIETIVKVSLWIVCSVGLITTILFGISLFTGVDNKIIESSWSNMFGILLTNSFSIIGTIMGVKYASESRNKRSHKKCDCDCND